MKPGDLVMPRHGKGEVGLFMKYMSYKELAKPHYRAYDDFLAAGADPVAPIWAQVLWPEDGLSLEKIRDIVIALPLLNA